MRLLLNLRMKHFNGLVTLIIYFQKQSMSHTVGQIIGFYSRYPFYFLCIVLLLILLKLNIWYECQLQLANDSRSNVSCVRTMHVISRSEAAAFLMLLSISFFYFFEPSSHLCCFRLCTVCMSNCTFQHLVKPGCSAWLKLVMLTLCELCSSSVITFSIEH